MNYLMSIVSIILLVGVTGFAQTASDINLPYTPFLIENATWIQFDAPDGFDNISYYAFKIQGDTVLNAETYKKLYRYELKKVGETSFHLLSQTFFMALREDTLTRRVYQLQTINNGDQLPPDYLESEFINFDYHIGDVFTNYFLIEAGVKIVTDTITFIYGKERRTLIDASGIALIEGIGYEDGLFLEPHTWTHAGFGFGLVDYCQDINFNCNILTSINSYIAPKVKIFPNPTSDFINVEFKQFFKGKITLSSVTGQIILTSIFSGIDYQIDIRELTSGIYLLNLESEKGQLIQKIMIE